MSHLNSQSSTSLVFLSLDMIYLVDELSAEKRVIKVDVAQSSITGFLYVW